MVAKRPTAIDQRKARQTQFPDDFQDTAILVRLSSVDDYGMSIARQIERCQALCDRNGWPVPPGCTFIEEDESAFLDGPREVWEEAKSVLRSRRLRRLVYPRTDRLSRNVGNYVVDLVEFKALGIELVSGETGFVDLQSPEGFAMEVSRCASAERQSLSGSHNVYNGQQDLRRVGVAHTSRRAFGFANTRLTEHHPVCAGAIRTARDMIIGGFSWWDVADEWRRIRVPRQEHLWWTKASVKRLVESDASGLDAGVAALRTLARARFDSGERMSMIASGFNDDPTVAGPGQRFAPSKPWRAADVMRMCLRPRNAGLVWARELQEYRTGDPDNVVESKRGIRPIISEEDWYRMKAISTQRYQGSGERATYDGSTYWLSGLIRCTCKYLDTYTYGKRVGQPHRFAGETCGDGLGWMKDKGRFTCRGCARTSMFARDAEPLVEGAVFEAVRSGALRAINERASDADGSLEQMRFDIQSAEREYQQLDARVTAERDEAKRERRRPVTAGLINDRQRCEAERDESRRAYTAALARLGRIDIDPSLDIAQVWAQATHGWKRQLVCTIFKKIEILPARIPGKVGRLKPEERLVFQLATGGDEAEADADTGADAQADDVDAGADAAAAAA